MRRIRRALRKALGKGSWKPVRKHLEVLRHLESSIHHHVDRELLALFRESRAWQSTPVTIEEIRVGTQPREDRPGLSHPSSAATYG